MLDLEKVKYTRTFTTWVRLLTFVPVLLYSNSNGGPCPVVPRLWLIEIECHGYSWSYLEKEERKEVYTFTLSFPMKTWGEMHIQAVSFYLSLGMRVRSSRCSGESRYPLLRVTSHIELEFLESCRCLCFVNYTSGFTPSLRSALSPVDYRLTLYDNPSLPFSSSPLSFTVEHILSSTIDLSVAGSILLLSPIDYRLTYPSPSPVGTLRLTAQLFAPLLISRARSLRLQSTYRSLARLHVAPSLRSALRPLNSIKDSIIVIMTMLYVNKQGFSTGFSLPGS